MTIGFMGLFVALLSEWITERLNILLIPMCLLGIGSVYYWYINDDLRFYAWIQFFPLIMIIIIRLLYTPQYSHQNWLLIGLGFYVLSKVCEHFDNQIFAITNSIISGHTIKHFTAAIATYCIYLMLKKRSET